MSAKKKHPRERRKLDHHNFMRALDRYVKKEMKRSHREILEQLNERSYLRDKVKTQ